MKKENGFLEKENDIVKKRTTLCPGTDGHLIRKIEEMAHTCRETINLVESLWTCIRNSGSSSILA